MSDMHQSMSIERLCRELPKLHGQVIRNWGRIQIKADNGNDSDACVLISRAELECLERALELFCESPQGKEICEEIGRVANDCTPRALGSAAASGATAGGVMAMTIGEESSSSSFTDERPGM